MTAVDVSQQVEQVKLAFMNGDTELSSGFFEADASQIICPVVSAPEGKIFSGWMVEETDASGKEVMRVVFQPDNGGTVILPVGAVLESMVLYPLFEAV